MSKITLAIILSCSSLSIAQDGDVKKQTQQIRSFSTDHSSKDYRLGPGDLIEITVFGVTNFDQVLRVSSSGKVTFPLLGKIEVAGLTGEELEERLADIIAEQKLVRDPQVSVFIKEYRSQPVYVLGAVNQPGQYMITHQIRLIDAITMAGGLDSKRVADHLLLQRRTNKQKSDGMTSGRKDVDPADGVVEIDLKALLEEGDRSLNVPIQGGDVIQVPERKVDVFYVVGEVGRAGAFEFPRDQKNELLLSQALVWAGGPARTAKMREGILVRYDDNGGRRELPVDFKAILSGKKPDFPIRPNDIIFIPGSTFKTLGYSMLGIIPGTVQGTIIWRRY